MLSGTHTHTHTHRSNTGVVDVYEHDGAGGGCRLLKALVPPKRSKHTNVKVTCAKLDPRGRLLAVGNILGGVNVILLDFSEGGRAQKMLHSHAHHQVRLSFHCAPSVSANLT